MHPDDILPTPEERSFMSDEPEMPEDFNVPEFLHDFHTSGKLARAYHDANARYVRDGRVYSDGEVRCMMEENGLWEWYKAL